MWAVAFSWVFRLARPWGKYLSCLIFEISPCKAKFSRKLNRTLEETAELIALLGLARKFAQLFPQVCGRFKEIRMPVNLTVNYLKCYCINWNNSLQTSSILQERVERKVGEHAQKEGLASPRFSWVTGFFHAVIAPGEVFTTGNPSKTIPGIASN